MRTHPAKAKSQQTLHIYSQISVFYQTSSKDVSILILRNSARADLQFCGTLRDFIKNWTLEEWGYTTL